MVWKTPHDKPLPIRVAQKAHWALLRDLGGQMAKGKRTLMNGSFVTATLRQAKQLVTKAFDAIASGTTTGGQHANGARSPVGKRARRKPTARATHQAEIVTPKAAIAHAPVRRGTRSAAARKVQRVIAKAKHDKGAGLLTSAFLAIVTPVPHGGTGTRAGGTTTSAFLAIVTPVPRGGTGTRARGATRALRRWYGRSCRW